MKHLECPKAKRLKLKTKHKLVIDELIKIYQSVIFFFSFLFFFFFFFPHFWCSNFSSAESDPEKAIHEDEADVASNKLDDYHRQILDKTCIGMFFLHGLSNIRIKIYLVFLLGLSPSCMIFFLLFLCAFFNYIILIQGLHV